MWLYDFICGCAFVYVTGNTIFINACKLRGIIFLYFIQIWSLFQFLINIISIPKLTNTYTPPWPYLHRPFILPFSTFLSSLHTSLTSGVEKNRPLPQRLSPDLRPHPLPFDRSLAWADEEWWKASCSAWATLSSTCPPSLILTSFPSMYSFSLTGACMELSFLRWSLLNGLDDVLGCLCLIANSSFSS